LRFRFSLLMFLQYMAPAALLQLYSLHLEQLGINPVLAGICCATQALASVLSALLVGQAADRWFSAERCLAVCALLASLTLYLLAQATTFWPLFLLTLFFWMLVNPTMQLGTTICFIHLRDPEREFGPIRMWGTVGWMVPGWLLALGGRLFGTIGPGVHPRFTDLFLVGSFFSLVLGLYALTIPHTPPRPSKDRRPAPLAALALLRSSSFIVYCVCTLGLCLTFPFTTQATPLLLLKLGVPLEWLSPVLTLAQVTEIIALGLLPMFLLRLELRGTMLMGLIAWMTVTTILAVGRPMGLVIGSLCLNGLFVTGFLVAGQVFVNRHATGDLRASAQSLLSFVNGLGMLMGHLLIGYLRWDYGGDLPKAFTVAAIITGCLLLLFVVGFRDRLWQPGKESPLEKAAPAGKVVSPPAARPA
jgi:MFS family permease